MQNNEQHIKKCLESIKNINAEVLLYDLESQDNTVSIAKQYYNVYNIKDDANRSKIRNLIIENKSEWHCYINPWEHITNSELINNAIKNTKQNYYHFLILQNNIIYKEVRLWKNLKFNNYVYESINVKEPNILNCMVFSNGYNINNLDVKLIKWINDHPNLATPLYYRACNEFSKSNWNNFILTANHYLLTEQEVKVPTIMIKYYLSIVYLHIKQDYAKSIQQALEIIAVKPLMAEFWCLLGDIYYKMKEYYKAKSFYENAMILGSKRDLNDLYPLEITKYKEYPEHLINSCENILKNLVIA